MTGSSVCHQGSGAWHCLCPCTAPGFWQGDETHGSSFPVKGRANRFALRADQEPGWFLMPQPSLVGSEVSLMPLGHCPDVPHPSPLCFPPRKTPHCNLPELSGKAEGDGAKDMDRRGRSLLPSLLPWASQELARTFRRSGES